MCLCLGHTQHCNHSNQARVERCPIQVCECGWKGSFGKEEERRTGDPAEALQASLTPSFQAQGAGGKAAPWKTRGLPRACT